jgi:hypothetical protein
MDPVSIATSAMAAQAAQVQTKMAASFMKMNADSSQAIASLLEAATQNANTAANAAAGIGQNLDITA